MFPLENDPNGVDQHAPGAKLDSGKNRLAMVMQQFAKALWAVGEVGTYGANKYSEGGWQHVDNGIQRYDDAYWRHWFKEKMGEEYDPETNYLHAAHEAWNALARLELILRNKNA